MKIRLFDGHYLSPRILFGLVGATFLAIVLMLLPLATVQAAQPWDGIYRVDGVNPDGSTYAGAVEIAEAKGSALYEITWLLNDGASDKAYGFEYDGQLHASGMYEPLAFALTPDGEARWAQPDAAFKVLGREKLTRTSFKTLQEAVKAPPPARVQGDIRPALRLSQRVF